MPASLNEAGLVTTADGRGVGVVAAVVVAATGAGGFCLSGGGGGAATAATPGIVNSAKRTKRSIQSDSGAVIWFVAYEMCDSLENGSTPADASAGAAVSASGFTSTLHLSV